jgi:hypothetical protein
MQINEVVLGLPDADNNGTRSLTRSLLKKDFSVTYLVHISIGCTKLFDPHLDKHHTQFQLSASLPWDGKCVNSQFHLTSLPILPDSLRKKWAGLTDSRPRSVSATLIWPEPFLGRPGPKKLAQCSGFIE